MIINLCYCYEKVFILMNIWIIGKNLMPKKEDFYSDLNMEDATDPDYAHLKRVCKDFEIKNLGKCHDL